MSVTSYIREDETFFKVYVHLRSKKNKSIRLQKFKSGFLSKKKAQLEENKMIKELSYQLAKLEGKGLEWNDLIDSWFRDSCKSSLLSSEAVTNQDHLTRLKKFTSIWSGKFASDITRNECLEVLESLKQTGANNTLLKKIRASVNVVFNWAIEQKLTDHQVSPLASVRIPKEKKKSSSQILTFEEIRLLLHHARIRAHPWYPIWTMAVLTGMRSGEMYALRWKDVHWEKNIIRVERSYNRRLDREVSTKSGEWRSVPISSELLEILQQLPKGDGEESYVLPRIKEWCYGQASLVLKAFLFSLGIKKDIVFHSLRACFATHLLSLGVDPAKIMKIGGWSDLATFQIYVRLSGVEESGATELLKVLNYQS